MDKIAANATKSIFAQAAAKSLIFQWKFSVLSAKSFSTGGKIYGNGLLSSDVEIHFHSASRRLRIFPFGSGE